MKIKGFNIIKTHRRKQETVNEKLGVILNGSDNAYPDRMENIIRNSVSAKQCTGIYSKFLKGYGFEDESLNDVVFHIDKITGKSVTGSDLLSKIAKKISWHNGLFLHLGFNGKLEVSSITLKDVKNIRFGKPDDNNYKGRLVECQDWAKNSKLNYKNLKKYNTYSPFQKVIRYQATGKDNPTDTEVIESIINEKWNGQLYQMFLDDDFVYPIAPIDVVQFDADSEYQVSLFKNGELRRGFFAKMIVAYEEFESEEMELDFLRDLKTFEGAEQGGSILVLKGVNRNDKGDLQLPISFQEIKQNINDDLFEKYEQSFSNNIRKAFGNIPQVLIEAEEGRLGQTSGRALEEAISFYNMQTMDDRDFITSNIEEVMKNWHDEKFRGRDWTIKKLDTDAFIDNRGAATD